jgi:MFS family permease
MASPTPTADGRYGAYALGVLLVAYVFAFMDRQILGLLVEPIKHDLKLNDLQISLLQGLAFAVFLSLAGLPIGRAIDTGRRTGLLALGIGLWSLAAAAGGLARAFWPLFLSRVGVGVGEAVMTPCAYSLIGDYFSRRRQGLAISVFAIGPYLGAGLALVLGGALVSLPGVARLGVRPWQAAFLAVGLAGFVPALWVATLREPARLGQGERPPTWQEVAAYARIHGGAALGVMLSQAFLSMATYAAFAWSPAMLIRTFQASPLETGRDLGLLSVACGSAGTLSAGLIGDVLRRGGAKNGRVIVLIAGVLAAGAAGGLLAAATGRDQVLALVGVFLTGATLASGSCPALLQEITPGRLRGVQHALAVLTSNLIGLGMGPTAVALVTDLVLHDERRLKLSLAIALPVMLAVAAVLAVAVARRYRASLAAMDENASKGLAT